MKKIVLFFASVIAMTGQHVLADAPESFEKAKIALREKVYFDRQTSDVGDMYCGCRWTWMGRSGGRIDLKSCGYEVRADSNRAQRIEWEHIVPAWVLGHQRQCWQKGGRENCKSSDPVFRVMEADMHNLSPTIGEVNADRSNYSYGMLPSTPAQYGACPTRTDFKQRVTEPRDAVKGLVARVQFYMHDRYGLSMSRQQQQLFMAWNRMYPASAWERERDQRIAQVMGHHNPFVTGERTWTLGHKPSREGLAGQGTATPARRPVEPPVQVAEESGSAPVIGNSASKIYHLPVGCPSYEQVQEKNRVSFGSAADAEAAGFRRAGNCR
ncbi:endonuclease [Azotobacter vinelandii]